MIVNGSGKTVVVMSLDDFNSYNETDYLTSTAANKAMMYKAKAEIEQGNLTIENIESLKKQIAR